MDDTLPVWVRDYIGIPFRYRGRHLDEGLDCWGLIRVVYRDRFGLELPSYLDRAYNRESVGTAKKAIEDGAETLFVKHSTAARVGDCVMLHIRGLPLHVALYAGREGGREWLLHTTESRGRSFRETLCSRNFEHSQPEFYRLKTA